MMALVDASYKFLYVDIGKSGRAGDGRVFADCDLREALDDGSLNIPTQQPYPHDDEPMPFFMIGDDAFPLRHYLMKPFPQRGLTNAQRIYNYRLSRARRTVENAFGILANRYYMQHLYTLFFTYTNLQYF
jgi:hypothetical protein